MQVTADGVVRKSDRDRTLPMDLVDIGDDLAVVLEELGYEQVDVLG